MNVWGLIEKIQPGRYPFRFPIKENNHSRIWPTYTRFWLSFRHWYRCW